MQILNFDTIIVGSGLAGLSAAYHASKYGTVAIFTKSQLDTSNSYYAQGGIAGAIMDGETNIPGLFACGEVASTGVMGANRLASNSLLECLVFGKRASEKAAQRKNEKTNHLPLFELTNKKENEQDFLDIKNEIADLMSENVGIVRDGKKLTETITKLEEIGNKLPSGITDFNLLKTKQIKEICLLITQSALLREESRGGHIREDFQHESPEFRLHIIQQKKHEPIFTPIRK